LLLYLDIAHQKLNNIPETDVVENQGPNGTGKFTKCSDAASDSREKRSQAEVFAHKAVNFKAWLKQCGF